MMARRLHLLFGLLALSMVLASAPLARADDERAKMLKAFRAAEKRIDKLHTKCDRCKGRGKLNGWSPVAGGRKVPGGRKIVQEGRKIIQGRFTCPTCDGSGRALPRGGHQDFVDNYVAYCELIEEYRAALAEQKNGRLSKRVHARQSKYASFIRNNVGIGTRWSEVPGGNIRGRSKFASTTADKRYTALAYELILLQSSAVGRGIAFEAEVVEVFDDVKYAGERVAEVAIVNTEVLMLICYVTVPSGARWVTGAKVQVIGKLIDAGYLAILPAPFDPVEVLVKPYPGTE